MRFHWFLPTGGDARRLSPSVHGAGIGGASGAPADPADPGDLADPADPAGMRPVSLEYLTLAQAADSLGYEGVLTPTGAHCEDAWIVTAALIAATRRLRFLAAFRPGLVSPVSAAQMAATFQRLSQGRLLLNVVTGGSDAEQRGYGDVLDHDQRYERRRHRRRRAAAPADLDSEGQRRMLALHGGDRSRLLVAPNLWVCGRFCEAAIMLADIRSTAAPAAPGPWHGPRPAAAAIRP